MNGSDLDIINAVQNGDYDAFRELYRRYSDLIYRNILVRVNSSFDADDIFQDFFIKLWERRQSLEIATNVRAYLLVWLKNHILNFIKEEQIRYKYHEESVCGRDHANDYEWVKIVSVDFLEQLRKVVDKFPPGLQAVYVLRREEQLSIKEIAERLSVSEQTIKNQLTTISGRLKTEIRKKNFIYL